MKKIRLFLYLDQEKIMSLYSQMFEGVIESFLDRKESKKIDQENQKGPIGSGNILSDSKENTKETTEKKILNDHIFSIFEKEMFEQNNVLCISESQPLSQEIKPLKFVKVTGQATFFDSEVVIKLLDDFNSLGQSFAYLNFMDKPSPSKKDMDTYIKDNNFHLDKDFTRHLKNLLLQTYKNTLELEINIDSHSYTALLNRDYLRESEELLIGKLSRKTEAEITLFGITTQVNNLQETNYQEGSFDETSFKTISKNLIYPILEVEKSFSGKTSNEIIINPLAIYLELN